ncbi:unnamed protein product (macronuclear) [Paramecium tetraurelia]|uniref:C2H2-type domain-containing protein n=1 Tax=Paramecium tetraurelia TaxID=5888 RepID=A0DGN3_PARTE|nr:uncharacterized protein GSPATT00002329001 [Paramecium tetraurelia]CAK82200.1 unnamed protein product [Paramecium tetraurelia]|eukprot:XP_001449597.1 hypothetical protein (macronuclear) [Paramecium tetraurelia strain d4-2]
MKHQSNSEEEYIANVLSAFLKIRQQEEKNIAIQLTQLLQSYKQEDIKQLKNLKVEQRELVGQMNLNIKQEQHKSNSNENTQQQLKALKPSYTNSEKKGDKYTEYGILEDGAYTCLKCQSKIKRTQDLLKHWTVQHGRQAIPRRKRNMINEDTQCIKKVSQENPKLEA